ncbi:MAG: chorismate mutase [Anaerolineales bacterium]|nr:chorismate mutase [Anaerolineales bacterium]
MKREKLMGLCAIRGAITVETNSRSAILAAAREMLQDLVAKNDLQTDRVVSAWFSATPDLDAAAPAAAARELGWTRAALLCVQEMPVQDSLPMCIRVLVLWDTDKTQAEMQHSYLRDAVALRPDLV